MAIKEKASQEDLILYEILRNPVLNTEFIHNVDRDERFDTEFELSILQKEILCDFNPYVSIATARAVGKTVSLVGVITWIMTFGVFPDGPAFLRNRGLRRLQIRHLCGRSRVGECIV